LRRYAYTKEYANKKLYIQHV